MASSAEAVQLTDGSADDGGNVGGIGEMNGHRALGRRGADR